MVRLRLLAVSLAIGALVGCSGAGPDSAFVTVREATIDGPLPAAVDAPVLDILDGDRVVHSLDLATIEKLETVDLTVFEPFVEREHTYRGVPFTALLDAVGLADASAVRMVALDDYVVTLTPDELAEAILATRQDGAPIDLAEGGPIRVIHAPDSEAGRNTDNWIWSVRTMAAA